MKQALFLLAAVAALVIVGSTGAGRAAADVVVYQQTFDNTTRGNLLPSTAGWTVHGAVAGNLFNNTNIALISNAKGDPNVGAATGFLAVAASPAGNRAMMWTDLAAKGIVLNRGAITTLSWYQGNVSKADVFQVAVRDSKGNWFVSNATTPPQNSNVPTTTDFSTLGNYVSVNFSNLTWSNLIFNGTSTTSSNIGLSQGSSSTGPVGQITAVGLYDATITGAALRIDTFTVNAVPEPSPLLLTALGAAGGFVVLEIRKRRRAKHAMA